MLIYIQNTIYDNIPAASLAQEWLKSKKSRITTAQKEVSTCFPRRIWKKNENNNINSMYCRYRYINIIYTTQKPILLYIYLKLNNKNMGLVFIYLYVMCSKYKYSNKNFVI